jgi:glycosyltransferase involved in cell wall biosynthesis
MDSPTISVILAVYNGDRFVEEALASVLGQTFGDFELLVVDDGSTDETPRILSGLDDPRVRVLRNPENLGLARSLNRGLAEARGELIARQDADDVSERDRFARQVRFLGARPEVAMVGCEYRQIDPNGEVVGRVRLPRDHVALMWALHFHCPFVHSGVLWRREPVAAEVGAYDEGFGTAMDYEMWHRIAARFAVANLPVPLVRYRVGPHSMTSTDPRVEDETKEIWRRYSVRLLPPGPAEGPSPEARFERVSRMIRGGWVPRSVEEAEPAVQDLLALQRAFATEMKLEAGARKAHLDRVRSTLARHLMRAAYLSRSRGQAAPARGLFRKAARIHWRGLATPKALRYLLAGLHRSATDPETA